MTTATPQRLPSGRRSRGTRSREDVALHQRERMLVAITSASAESGYGAVTVTDVITRAGVSRATFYQQFADREDCFLAAFDRAVQLLITELEHSASGERPGSVAEIVGAYLEAVVRQEALARVMLIDSATLGVAGVVRRAASQRLISAGLARLVGAVEPAQLFACDALVAAVGSMVTVRLAQRDLDGVRALHEPVVALANRLFGT